MQYLTVKVSISVSSPGNTHELNFKHISQEVPSCRRKFQNSRVGFTDCDTKLAQQINQIFK